MSQLSNGHVFMSYSRRDDVVMRRVVAFLRKQGIKVWVDNEKLIPGTPIWEEEIEKAIKNAPAVVVVASPDSKKSEWVRREISLADQYKRRVFPVLVRGDEEDSITIRLVGRQYVDIRNDEDAGLSSMSASLLLYLEGLKIQEQLAEDERIEREKVETENRLHEAKEEANRLTIQKAEEERLSREKAENEHKVRVEAALLATQLTKEKRLAAEKAEAERKTKQKPEEERIAKAKTEEYLLTTKKTEGEPIEFANQRKKEEKVKIKVADKESRNAKAPWVIFGVIGGLIFVLSLFGFAAIKILPTMFGGAVLDVTKESATIATVINAQRTEVPVTQAFITPLELKYASSAKITTWDPIASFSTEAAYMANIYEQLVRVNPPGSAEKYTPLLAESWDKSANGLVWTFKLRSGVKFHDGEPMNANAVVKSIEAARDYAGASYIWYPLDKVEAVDDMTVQFSLKSAQPLELILGSEYAAYIVSPNALDAAAANTDYWNAGVDAGTGPYMIKSYVAEKELVLTQNKDYWGGWKPGQYEKVLVQFVSDSTTQQQMLEGAEVDLVTNIPVESYATLATNPSYVVTYEPTLYNYTAFFNTLKPPLDNVKVRQALSYAIPYDDIIKIGANGLGTQSHGSVPAGVFPYSANVKQYTYDLDKAKSLLKEAGYDGGGFSLKLTYPSSNSTEKNFVPLIKDSFQQIGVNVTIQPMQFSEQWALAKTDPTNAQDIFLLLYWPSYSDAGMDNMWSLFYGTKDAPHLNASKFNLSYWFNEQYNAFVDDAGRISATDPTTSLAKYTEAQNLLIDEAPAGFLFVTKIAIIVPARITGFKYNINYPDVRFWFYDLHSSE